MWLPYPVSSTCTSVGRCPCLCYVRGRVERRRTRLYCGRFHILAAVNSLRHDVHRLRMGTAAATSPLARDTGTISASLIPTLQLSFGQTETLFQTYAQFASLTKPPQTPSEDELRTQSQLEDLLERVCHLPEMSLGANNPLIISYSAKPSSLNSPACSTLKPPSHPPH